MLSENNEKNEEGGLKLIQWFSIIFFMTNQDNPFGEVDAFVNTIQNFLIFILAVVVAFVVLFKGIKLVKWLKKRRNK